MRNRDHQNTAFQHLLHYQGTISIGTCILFFVIFEFQACWFVLRFCHAPGQRVRILGVADGCLGLSCLGAGSLEHGVNAVHLGSLTVFMHLISDSSLRASERNGRSVMPGSLLRNPIYVFEYIVDLTHTHTHTQSPYRRRVSSLRRSWLPWCRTFGPALPAGLFVPQLLAGAAYGRAIGQFFVQYTSHPTYVGGYALVGAASMLGGTIRYAMFPQGTTAIPVVFSMISRTRNVFFRKTCQHHEREVGRGS